MCATFTDADVDKPVENDNGEEVGVVAAVEGDIARIRPDPTVVESIKSSLGWEKGAEESVVLEAGSVREITDDVVRLEGEFHVEDVEDAAPDESGGDEPSDEPQTEPAGGTSGIDETELTGDMADDEEFAAADEMDAIEEANRDRGAEVDPTELTERTAMTADPDELATDSDEELERRTDAAVEPDEERHRTDASVDPDEGHHRTDAAVDPDEGARRNDARMDPDAVRDMDPTARGPTTEDADPEAIEGEPETERLTDADADSDSDSDRDSDADHNSDADHDSDANYDSDADRDADTDRDGD